jgi:hypothetical protein
MIAGMVLASQLSWVAASLFLTQIMRRLWRPPRRPGPQPETGEAWIYG